MKLARLSPIALAVSGAILLSACGGGGGGSSSSGTAAPTSTSITVTPSLGKFSTACNVEIRKSTGELLGSAPVASNGTAVVSIPADYSGVIIAQIKGASGCTYFDEAAGETPFGAGQQLSAVVDGVRSNLGVNALTNLAAARLLDGNKLAADKTSDQIKTENATVQLMFQVGDMFAAPTLIGKSTDTIDNTEAGKLAAKLAALAEIASTLSKNVATLAAELAADLKDGTLDGIENTQLQAGLTAAVNKFADSTSKTALLDLPANTSLRTRTSDVQTDAAKVLAAGDDLRQAKQIFADLRTSIISISNEAGTGSLDVQNEQLQNDFQYGVDIGQTVSSMSLMIEASREFFLGTETTIGNDFFKDGFCEKHSNSYAECWFYSSELSKAYAVALTLTGTNTVQWEVTADVDPSQGGSPRTLSGLTGTINLSGTTTTLTGNFYPMTGDAAKTAVNFSFMYSGNKGEQAWSGNGTLNAVKADGATSTLKFEATEVAISEARKTAKFVAALASPHHIFNGTLEFSGETLSKDGQSSPKDAKLVGSFTNTATGFKFLEGTLTGTLDQSNYNHTLEKSASNYDTFAYSFKGTAYKSANVPGVGLDLIVSNSSYTQRNASFSFTGTNGLAIAGTGTQIRTADEQLPSTWNITNANGIKATYDSAAKSGKVLKADGSTLGTISNQRVTFIDGTFESLI